MRRPSAPGVLLAAGLLVAGLLAAGCSGPESPRPAPTSSAPASSAEPSATPTTARPVARPEVGACYRLSYDAAVAPTTRTRPTGCDGPHTSATFFVGTLPQLLDGHLLAVDSDRVQEAVAAECPRRLARWVGGSLEDRRLSMLRAVWFTPTVERADEGADWFRCDVVALAADERLARVTGDLRGVLGSEAGRERYGLCGTARPGTSGAHRVICSGEHSWRAVQTVTFASGSYPGVRRARSAGDDTCKDAGRDAADDSLDFEWGYEWPSADQWAAGQTYGFCWVPD